MSAVNTPAGLDQAEGLRSLFGNAAYRVICLACALDPDTIIHIGHGTALAIKNQGQSVLLVDEVPLNDRKTMSGFLYPTKYDLGQVFTNSVHLSKSIRAIEENLWYATGAKVRTYFKTRQAKLPALDERLQAIEVPVDYILIATDDPDFNIIKFYGKSVQRILVASPEFASLSAAMNMIKTLALYQDNAPLPTLIIGGTEIEANAAFDKLNTASQATVAQPLKMLGWVEAIKIKRVTINPDDLTVTEVIDGQSSEFVLPMTFFNNLQQSITD